MAALPLVCPHKQPCVEEGNVLSALNGLREEVLDLELKYLKKSVETGVSIRISVDEYLNLLNKWFPILSDEVKEE